MKPRLTTTAYTNAILTVIAAALVLLTLHVYRVEFASPAQAQALKPVFGQPSTGVSRAAVDTGNIAQSQDLAVAAATSEVAQANRDIAAAIRELAKAVDSAGSAIAKPAPAPAAASGNAGDITVQRTR